MTHPALLIYFTGIDGSGKTTQAKLLLDWLESRGITSQYVWSRGAVRTMRSILLFMGRRVLGTSARKISNDVISYRQYQSRKLKLMEHSLVRTLWSATTYIEHLAQINLEIRPKIRNGCVIVCDRYLWDSIIDLAVLNNKDPEWLLSTLHRFTWKLVPQPTITLLIDIPPEEAIKRKEDIPSYEYVRRRAVLYRYLAEHNSLTIIDGCGDAAVIQKRILNTIESHLVGETV